MTDAREIIAQHLCEKTGQGWSGISTYERAAYRTSAHGMIEAITTAGCRILGPDEVQALDRTLRNALEARLPPVVAQDVAAAIRNLGEKA